MKQPRLQRQRQQQQLQLQLQSFRPLRGRVTFFC